MLGPGNPSSLGSKDQPVCSFPAGIFQRVYANPRILAYLTAALSPQTPTTLPHHPQQTHQGNFPGVTDRRAWDTEKTKGKWSYLKAPCGRPTVLCLALVAYVSREPRWLPGKAQSDELQCLRREFSQCPVCRAGNNACVPGLGRLGCWCRLALQPAGLWAPARLGPARGSECAQHDSASWPGFLPGGPAVSTDYQ